MNFLSCEGYRVVEPETGGPLYIGAPALCGNMMALD
jgi:hypothetical protein